MKQSGHRHLSISVDNVRRHHGDSFARQVAYVCRGQVNNPRTDQTHDFREAGPVAAMGSAGWEGSIEELVSEAVASERRRDAVEGRVAIVAIAHELTAAERIKAVEGFCAYLVATFGVAVVWAIHPPSDEGDQRNWHFHALWTSRRVLLGRRLGEKTRELDVRGTSCGHIEGMRKFWSTTMNAALCRAGCEPDVEHRSFARLGNRAEPTRHEGERLTAIRRREQTAVWAMGGLGVMRPLLPTPILSPIFRPLPVPHQVAPERPVLAPISVLSPNASIAAEEIAGVLEAVPNLLSHGRFWRAPVKTIATEEQVEDESPVPVPICRPLMMPRPAAPEPGGSAGL